MKVLLHLEKTPLSHAFSRQISDVIDEEKIGMNINYFTIQGIVLIWFSQWAVDTLNISTGAEWLVLMSIDLIGGSHRLRTDSGYLIHFHLILWRLCGGACIVALVMCGHLWNYNWLHYLHSHLCKPIGVGLDRNYTGNPLTNLVSILFAPKIERLQKVSATEGS